MAIFSAAHSKTAEIAVQTAICGSLDEIGTATAFPQVVSDDSLATIQHQRKGKNMSYKTVLSGAALSAMIVVSSAAVEAGGPPPSYRGPHAHYHHPHHDHVYAQPVYPVPVRNYPPAYGYRPVYPRPVVVPVYPQPCDYGYGFSRGYGRSYGASFGIRTDDFSLWLSR